MDRQALFSAGIQLLVLIGTPIILALAVKVIRLFEAKTKIDVPEKTEQRIEAFLREAIEFAEEKAYQALKTTGQPIPGPGKLELAVKYAETTMQRYDMNGYSKSELADRIEARLPQARGMSNMTKTPPGAPVTATPGTPPVVPLLAAELPPIGAIPVAGEPTDPSLNLPPIPKRGL